MFSSTNITPIIRFIDAYPAFLTNYFFTFSGKPGDQRKNLIVFFQHSNFVFDRNVSFICDINGTISFSLMVMFFLLKYGKMYFGHNVGMLKSFLTLNAVSIVIFNIF